MVTFVATAFDEFNAVHMFLNSLLCQTNKNWNCIVYFNGQDKFQKFCSKDYSKLYHTDKIDFIASYENTQCWGAKNRNDALLNKVDTEYVINTSVQDYWVPTAVDEILKCKGVDFLYWNGINHIFGYEKVLDVEPQIGRIDWGNFAVKTQIAKQVGINKPEEFCADGYFVQDLMNSGLVKVKYKINKILTIHN